ncbi:EscC/YscC/HrcC family type III secretion system outer membrane ring protein [Edwardsiella anguillarum]|uniref:EscC/YscC/HrcC family type III secretion system outer membrane ring protein n=1 Tax=Edwardsiella anguillarum TaxID=1821960 RepID=UPI00045CA44D|nr:EscC/YscC/HrcC family type III secretion system outer membrane ring protein [Edwardsiella anguillarum]GAJ67842.1 protein EsaC [Edwardsiella piscicida]RFS99709.1 EscC/YscC/HrcC family type III secretion system outer membrane ring protein [Edwardsiella anguillarum]BET80095.1 EscC/YscC/HrcC family type III secretion system outer membrane ring protein [Edwardsiella anguillarum]BET83384.1 EscC/YscC/HrcC family type III secretion system outer membrane ring protein [Edwardsiella anguillarum]BET867
MRIIVLLLLLCGGFSASSLAQPIPWRGAPFFVSSQSATLASVLRDLGANSGVPVVVSPRITESYAGELRDTPRGTILAELSRLYQLLPYYDGNTLYIYKAQEMEQATLAPSYLAGSVLKRLLQRSGLLDGYACQVRQVASANALQVNGVPACLSQVTTLAKQLDEQDLNLEQNRETVAVFPLKYANASDTSYAYRSQSVVVPGLVSVLREMAQGHAMPLPDSKSGPPPSNGSGLPTFSADLRQNAVLIRDRKQNMALYRQLIQQLDKRPTLIEISVTIIDVDAGDINELGIDWSASARIGGGQVSFNSGGLNADSFSSLISNSGSFMVRLSALEQQSKAKIVSRPSVVTLDNVQAVLDRSITFYTKLRSEKNPKLEAITAGALMRVTPRLIRESAGNKILLILNIEDGRQGAPLSQAESLPQVQNAEIATQATLNLGQALLLGGFVQNENTQGVRKIPLLGDIPLIGGLFRSTDRKIHSVVRLFLIKAEPRQM